MQKINIPLLGLTSNSEARGIKDGECSIMHNLTADADGTKVITPPSKNNLGQKNKYKEYFHDKSEEWLCVENGNVFYNNQLLNKLNGTNDGYIDEISFMGNVVIMYCADGVRYAIYDGSYRYLGKLPTLPKFTISIKPTHITTLSDEEYYTESAEISPSEENLRWRNASKGYFDECLSVLYTQGAFIDRTLFRWAARLFDGSYVCYSPIYYTEDSDAMLENIGYHWLGKSHSIGRDNKNFFSTPRLITGSASSQYLTSVRGFIPHFKPETFDFKRWSDIIVAIELFATPSIMGHESRNDTLSTEAAYNLDTGSVQGGATVKLTTTNGYDRYVWKGAKKIREEVSDASLFYKIAEFDLEGKEVWRLDNTSPTQLALQTRLPINEQPHELSATAHKYIYNGKMHLAGVKELFTAAYSNYSFPGHSSGRAIQITSVVTISTEQGERRVVTTSKQPFMHKKGEDYMLPPLLHYADARAKNLRIYVCAKDGIYTPTVYKDFPLTAHKALNIAYFLNDANLGDEHYIEITTTAGNLIVETENTNKENAFIAGVKKEIPDRADYSGKYTFTFKGLLWDLDVTFSDNATVTKSNVTPYLYGLRLYGGNSSALYDFTIKEGDTITVTLDYGTGTLAGLNPIKVEFFNSEEWKTLTTNDANFSYDANGDVTGFSLKNIIEDREYARKNVMRVSQVDNPLFFPAKNTYSFDADIVALCSNNVALSQGQFGQHPLYVFTNEGIWLMTVDASGAGSYLAQIPCSREICNNVAGVSITTRGVVFPTTKGLMLINGSEVVNISESI
ncbi:MAG: hypothetical protein IIV19_01025, partial [Bacteroidaceae bacterium]|nr:hypothetical protein [Bacteroidaceae bacterium]